MVRVILSNRPMKNKNSDKKVKIKENIMDSSIKSEKQRFVWFDTRESQGKKDKVLLALQNTIFDTLVVKPSQIADIRALSSRIKLVVFVEKIDELSTITQEDIVASENPKILTDATKREEKQHYLLL